MKTNEVKALESAYEAIISSPDFVESLKFDSIIEVKKAIIYFSRKEKPDEEIIDLLLKRIKELSKIYLINFEDCEQDFLCWEVLEDGSIINSTPFQSSVWTKYKVVNLDALILGQAQYAIISNLENAPFAIKYKVLSCVLAK